MKSKSSDIESVAMEVAKIQMMASEFQKSLQTANKSNTDIKKGWQQLPNAPVLVGEKSWRIDPYDIQYSLGYKEKKYSLSIELIKRVVSQLAILNAIIVTRCNQVASFAQPYRQNKGLGILIKHKDPDRKTTSAELAFIKELEQFVMNCGRSEKNPHSEGDRDDFETFLRKIVRDSLMFDQVCAEIVYDTNNIPFEFVAVSAESVRLAADSRLKLNQSFNNREGFVPDKTRFGFNTVTDRNNNLYTHSGERVKYVQVINGVVENTYAEEELIFGIRNPRTDLKNYGYGSSETEMLINSITSFLFAEQYNQKMFSQGTPAKGMINIRGEQYNPQLLEDFTRRWQAMISGTTNTGQIPVMMSEGLEYINLAPSARDMEYMAYVEFLLKQICAVFQIDPSEIGFDISGGQSNTPLFESAEEWKLKASRDKGLKPLLRFIAKLINKNIIDRIDDHFYMEFVGLDELSEKEKHEMVLSQVGSYLTLNEARRSLDLPELPEGDYPLNPVYLNHLNQIRQEKMQKEQQAQQAAAGGGEQPPNPEEAGQEGTPQEEQPAEEPEEGGEEQQQAPTDFSPRFAANFRG